MIVKASAVIASMDAGSAAKFGMISRQQMVFGLAGGLVTNYRIGLGGHPIMLVGAGAVIPRNPAADIGMASASLGFGTSSVNPFRAKASTIETSRDEEKKLYHFTTTVSAPLRGSVEFDWWVDDGYIQFDFTENNYWGVYWRGGANALAEEMFNVTRGIDSEYLSGRTISGLDVDIQLHWILQNTIFLPDRISNTNAFVPRLGGLDSNKPGFDDNAWIFETANIASIINPLDPWGTIRALEAIGRWVFG